jgi:hypothetical protein
VPVEEIEQARQGLVVDLRAAGRRDAVVVLVDPEVVAVDVDEDHCPA